MIDDNNNMKVICDVENLVNFFRDGEYQVEGMWKDNGVWVYSILNMNGETETLEIKNFTLKEAYEEKVWSKKKIESLTYDKENLVNHNKKLIKDLSSYEIEIKSLKQTIELMSKVIKEFKAKIMLDSANMTHDYIDRVESNLKHENKGE